MPRLRVHDFMIVTRFEMERNKTKQGFGIGSLTELGASTLLVHASLACIATVIFNNVTNVWSRGTCPCKRDPTLVM